MDLNLLSEGKDPMGAAIYDYLKYSKAGRLRVFSSQFDEDEIPVAGLLDQRKNLRDSYITHKF